MTDLRAQLQSTLGPGYTFERELGGGGVSRVFVARENALGREVMVKVLAPELSASVSAERFDARSDQRAARCRAGVGVCARRRGDSSRHQAG